MLGWCVGAYASPTQGKALAAEGETYTVTVKNISTEPDLGSIYVADEDMNMKPSATFAAGTFTTITVYIDDPEAKVKSFTINGEDRLEELAIDYDYGQATMDIRVNENMNVEVALTKGGGEIAGTYKVSWEFAPGTNADWLSVMPTDDPASWAFGQNGDAWGAGKNITILFGVMDGYKLTSVKLNGTEIISQITQSTISGFESQKQYVIENLQADVNLVIAVEAITAGPYKVTLSYAEGTTESLFDMTTLMTADGSEIFDFGSPIPAGKMLAVILTPANGYAITSLLYNGTEVKDQLTDPFPGMPNKRYALPELTADVTLVVKAEKPTAPQVDPIVSWSVKEGSESYGEVIVKDKALNMGIENGKAVTYGNALKVQVTPNLGYVVDEMLINGENKASLLQGPNAFGVYTYEIASATQNLNIVVSFKEDPALGETAKSIYYRIVNDPDGHGTVSVKTVGADSKEVTPRSLVAAGTKINFEFTPNKDYIVKSLKINEVEKVADVKTETDMLGGTSYSYETVVNENLVIEITFGKESAKPVTVNFSVAQGQEEFGVVKAQASIPDELLEPGQEQFPYIETGSQVPTGAAVSFIVQPNERYLFEKALYNDQDVTAQVLPVMGDLTYYVEALDKDATFVAYFKADPAWENAVKVNFSVPEGQEKVGGLRVKNSSTGKALVPGQEVLPGTELNVNYYIDDRMYYLEYVKVNGEDVSTKMGYYGYTFKAGDTDVNIEASFQYDAAFDAAKTISYTVLPQDKPYMGVVEVLDGNYYELNSGDKVVEGDEVEITLTPNMGYKILSFKQGETDLTADLADDWFTPGAKTYNVEMGTEDLSFEITFAEDKAENAHKVSFSVAEGQEKAGIVTAEAVRPGAYWATPIQNNAYVPEDVVSEYQPLAFYIYPEDGFSLESVTKNGEPMDISTFDYSETYNAYTITFKELKADLDIVVTFKDNRTFPFVFEAGANGALKAVDAEGKEINSGDEVLIGTKVTVTATPDEGYQVENWIINSMPYLGDHATEKVITVAGETTVSATFSLKPEEKFAINFEANDGGELTATVDGTQIKSGDTFPAGTQVVFTAKVTKDNYELDRWTVNDQVVTETVDGQDVPVRAATYTLTVEAATTVKAVFGDHTGLNAARAAAVNVVIAGDNLVVTGLAEATLVELYSVNGQVVRAQVTDNGYNVSDVAAGIYLVKVNGNVYKVVKR